MFGLRVVGVLHTTGLARSWLVTPPSAATGPESSQAYGIESDSDSLLNERDVAVVWKKTRSQQRVLHSYVQMM